MKLKVFNYLVIVSVFLAYQLNAQTTSFTGQIESSVSGKKLSGVEIYDKNANLIYKTKGDGKFKLDVEIGTELFFFKSNYNIFQTKAKKNMNIKLDLINVQLEEINIKDRSETVFKIMKLKDIEKDAVFAGKKSEVITLSKTDINLSSNNARQIFSQVAGLNIYQNDDAGLQLNIGVRGLNPSRTANFNTRQNGYDISADVLGYPESYYTPTSESLDKIQIVRGAAALQYGTQFGGLINFVLKKPNQSKRFSSIIRNTLASNNLFTNYSEFSGKINKTEYLTSVNYKKGNGFRPNSNFESINNYVYLSYSFKQSKVSFESTILQYLAQQPGGLNDAMFNSNPLQSNRERNWFDVFWFLYNLRLEHLFSDNSNLYTNFFGLSASRRALGFRTNRVDQVDSFSERDLIVGNFQNFGLETKYLKRYNFRNYNNVLLIGKKVYVSNSDSKQGPGSDASDADFNFYESEFPYYSSQSEYRYPNRNFAFYGENIIYFSDKLSITPGFRFEYINTSSDGYYKKINLDAAGNPIFDTTYFELNKNRRNFMLFGLGISCKPLKDIEFYSNFSQNYRSVTFADISIINPSYVVNENIKDEDGFTFDLGLRGNYHEMLYFDISSFLLSYNERIGFIQKLMPDGNVKSERGNVGDATIYGLESLFNLNLSSIFDLKQHSSNIFFNTSIISSNYNESDQIGIQGNEVEFVPKINFKSGYVLSFKKYSFRTQLTYISSQFTDATNAIESNLSGVIGQIPEYTVLDISGSYNWKRIRVEYGINNVLDKSYFTRRATGYPGPGIIPSPRRNFYLTLELNF